MSEDRNYNFGSLALPPGYSVMWHGCHEHYQAHGPDGWESCVTWDPYQARRWCMIRNEKLQKQEDHMTTKHTPGPYHVETRQHVHAICCKPTRMGEHKEVAFIEVSAASFPGAPPGDLSAGSITAQQRSTDELSANARLFAAAPDLLAACKRARNAALSIGVDDPEAVASILATAIAKATGK